MINLMPKSRGRNKNKISPTYGKNFSLAVLNWERNRQEEKFSLTGFERNRLRASKLGYSDLT